MSKCEFKKVLDDIEKYVSGYFKNKKVIIGGDFNARSIRWNKINNRKGDLLKKWADYNELTILNDGKLETCIRTQGSSMVDIAH